MSKDGNKTQIDKKEALRRLYKDRVKNIMSIDPLERGVGKVLLITDESLIIRTKESILIHSESETDEELKLIIDEIKSEIGEDSFALILVHNLNMAKKIAELTGYKDIVPYFNAIFPEEAELKEIDVEGLEIKALTMENFDFVRKHYKLVNSDGYIKERIRHGMIGAWYKGELVGFAGEHDQGTMGMLEVIPKYRRLGIASVITNHLIRKMRKDKRCPHTNTSPNNKASIKLQRNFGFLFSQEPVYWLFKPDED